MVEQVDVNKRLCVMTMMLIATVGDETRDFRHKLVMVKNGYSLVLEDLFHTIPSRNPYCIFKFVSFQNNPTAHLSLLILS